jgi:hypothetical protein
LLNTFFREAIPNSAAAPIPQSSGTSHPYTDVSIPMHRFTPVEATVEVGTDDKRFLHQVRILVQDCVNQRGITNLRITAECPCEECET